ncbi:hypothetical protein DL768_009361 [Monosporascus sp. mg162]|nr:hypothetical protein DL768_009361 [Monosporascus sp. mg162]
MPFYFGPLTILVGCLCLASLGTLSKVRWLSPEKRMTKARISHNNTGNNRTGIKEWKWKRVRESPVDHCFWFAGINAFLSSVPNGGITTFAAIINTNAGFTTPAATVLDVPRNITSASYFVLIRLATGRWKNLRMWFMMFSTVLAFVGFVMMAMPPNDRRTNGSSGESWTPIPSNVGAHQTHADVVVHIRQLLRGQHGHVTDLQGQRRVPHTVLALRNRRRDSRLRAEGLAEEDHVAQGRELGRQDYTDLENPYSQSQPARGIKLSFISRDIRRMET